MNYGYIRVSSDKQTVENQRFEINRFAENEKITINGWIEETISGTKSYDKFVYDNGNIERMYEKRVQSMDDKG